MNLTRLQDPSLEPGDRKNVLSEAVEMAAACSREIRTATYLLHPPLLDEVGLVSALKAYAEGFKQRTGIDVEIKISPDFGRLHTGLESALFRIVQEGLANVHKHSGSVLAVVWLERGPQQVRLVLRDRGRGLPEALLQAKGFVQFGVGILGMRERAEQLGGQLELASNNGGTTMTVTLPLLLTDQESTNPCS
jgi:signal transduction histidine kinase